MTTKNLFILFVLLAVFLSVFHIYYKLVDIANASDIPQECKWMGSKVTALGDAWCLEAPNMVVSGGEKTFYDSRFNPTLIEKERELKQNLKLENEDLKKKLEEAKLLLERLEKKEKHCDDLQSRYNQIYLIVNQ